MIRIGAWFESKLDEKIRQNHSQYTVHGGQLSY